MLGSPVPDLEWFARELASVLQVEIGDQIQPETSLFDDWALDSLQAFEMIVVVEAMAGAVVPPLTMPELYTLGHAYEYFCALRADVGAVP